MMFMKFDVFKITEMKDDSVYKTRMLGSIWIECKSRTTVESNAIAKNHGGDMLAPTLDSFWGNELPPDYVKGIE